MHKYPFLYQQCENTFGYDELMERLDGYQILLEVLDTNCMRDSATILNNTYPRICDELIDFLDGNGFSIKYRFDEHIVYIIPITKENVK